MKIDNWIQVLTCNAFKDVAGRVVEVTRHHVMVEFRGKRIGIYKLANNEFKILAS